MNDIERLAAINRNDPRQDHEYAVLQARVYGKRILPADSTKDDTFISVGGVVGGLAALYLIHVLHIHGEMLQLLVGAIGVFAGFATGLSAFDWLFVKDQSWQPPVMNERR